VASVSILLDRVFGREVDEISVLLFLFFAFGGMKRCKGDKEGTKMSIQTKIK
jgi:hypothetical protein